MVKIGKKFAWLGTITFLIGFVISLCLSIIKHNFILGVVSVIGIIIYKIALGILILDSYIMRQEIDNSKEYKKTK
jgi:predicted RND superfamily exporter protein